MNYSDKLKSPKWQKKRLEILNIHGFKCDICKSEEKTINVHHIKYIDGLQPWEFDNDLLQVLCEDCHSIIHNKNSDDMIASLYEYYLKLGKDNIRQYQDSIKQNNIIAYQELNAGVEQAKIKAIYARRLKLSTETFMAKNAALEAMLSKILQMDPCLNF